MKITLDFTPAEFQAVLAESATLRALTSHNQNSTSTATFLPHQYKGETNPKTALERLKYILINQDYPKLPAIKYLRDCSTECRLAIFALYPQHTRRDCYANDTYEKRGLANCKHFVEFLDDEIQNRI